MSGLLFSFADLAQEIEELRSCVSPFLDVETRDQRMPAWRKKLLLMKSQPPGTAHSWQIPESAPLCTLAGTGYQPDSRGKHLVRGEVTARWDICIPVGKKQKKKGGASSATHFAVSGVASTVIRIVEQSEEGSRELAMWRFEIGDVKAPGCHFHAQILGKTVAPPFPSTLDVPRLPSIVVAPTDAIEFIIAELFQDQWPQEMKRPARQQHVLALAAYQRTRLGRVLDWYKEQVNAPTKETAWGRVKRSKPPAGLLSDS